MHGRIEEELQLPMSDWPIQWSLQSQDITKGILRHLTAELCSLPSSDKGFFIFPAWLLASASLLGNVSTGKLVRCKQCCIGVALRRTIIQADQAVADRQTPW